MTSVIDMPPLMREQFAAAADCAKFLKSAPLM
jgi:hypothetical protein